MRKFISLMMAVLCAGSMFAATYTVAGDSETLFGEGKTWKSDYAANDMTLVEGLYTWEKSDLTLASGSIFFKVCKDHGWTTAYPKDNYELKIPASGVYTVKITFNESTTSVNAVATKTGDAEVIPTIAMHGNFTGEWKTTENFTLAGDKKTASFKLNIKASATKYEFGMRIGGSGNWTSNGAAFTRASNSAVVNAGSGNLTLLADADGEYTFTWTYETNTLTVTYPEGAVIDLPKYYITGDSALVVDAGAGKDKAWNPGAIQSMKDTCVLNLKANQEYKLKITLDADWKTARGYDKLSKKADGLSADSDGNITFKLTEAGEVKVVFKALENDTTFELLGNFFVKPAVHKDGYYLMGSHNEWAIGDEYMFATTDVEGEYKLEVTLALDQEIKPARVAHDNAVEWFGANNYKVPAEYVGAKVIYFRPAGNEDAAWQAFGGYFLIASPATGIDNADATVKAVKTIENGMLVIEKAGVKYNVMGQVIR